VAAPRRLGWNAAQQKSGVRPSHMPPRKATSRIRRAAATPRREMQWLVLRVSLAEIEPEIWRTVGVPDRYSLHQLHRVVQFAFGWLDYHLYEFQIGARRFEAPDAEAEGEDSSHTTLAALSLQAGTTFTYVYDFGDYWTHEVRVEKAVPLPAEELTDALPRLLAGARAGPPEDVGGPPGYASFIEALRDPGHPEHLQNRTWVGVDYDPDRFDPWIVDRHLQLAAAWGAV